MLITSTVSVTPTLYSPYEKIVDTEAAIYIPTSMVFNKFLPQK